MELLRVSLELYQWGVVLWIGKYMVVTSAKGDLPMHGNASTPLLISV